MSTVIYWFSGSGNSFFAAKELAGRLEDCRLVRIAVEHGQLPAVEDCDSIGLVFPVYFAAPPALVKRFIEERLTGVKVSYLFTVFTHGGLPAFSVPIVDRALARAGLASSYGIGIKMVDTYIPLFKIPSTDIQATMRSQAVKAIETIAGEVRAQTIRIPRRLPFSNLFESWWRRKIRRMAESDKNFCVTDACTGCSLCAKHCPAANIEMHQGRPVYLHHCEQCLGCYHGCPVHAIELNPRPRRGYTWYPNEESGFRSLT